MHDKELNAIKGSKEEINRIQLIRCKMRCRMSFILIFLLGWIDPVWADQEWLIFGNLNMSNFRSSNLPGYGFGYGDSLFGFGLGTFVPFSEILGLEADLNYLRRDIFVRGQQDEVNRLRAQYLEIPIQVKFLISRFIRVGAGVYVAKGFAPVSLIYSDGSRRSTSFMDADLSTNDFGVMGSGTVRFPLGDSIQVFGEFRYHRGLKNLGLVIPAGTEFHYTDLRILFVFSFAFEAPQNRIKPNQFYFR